VVGGRVVVATVVGATEVVGVTVVGAATIVVTAAGPVAAVTPDDEPHAMSRADEPAAANQRSMVAVDENRMSL
jgi:hypothetical protein